MNCEAVLQVACWVKAEELRAGDVSKTDKGTLRIAKVHVDPRSEEVYNFEVAENHTYLVTDQGVVVHNECFFSQYKHDVRMLSFIVNAPYAAIKIGNQVSKPVGVEGQQVNITQNATRIANHAGLEESMARRGKGTGTNALRHMIWTGSIASQFGPRIALWAGNAHEETLAIPSDSELQNRVFKGIDSGLKEADRIVDLKNNQIAIEMGQQMPKASMRDVAMRSLDIYHERGLYQAIQIGPEEYVIRRRKLSTVRYQRAQRALFRVDSRGFLPDEAKRYEKANSILEKKAGYDNVH